MSIFKKVQELFRGRQMIIAITIAVTAALTMTAMSLKLYDMNYVSRLDVSLPNRENLRPKTTNDEETKKFDSSGPLDSQAFSDFYSSYKDNRNNLDVLGKYDGSPLSNESLQFGSNE